MARLIDGKSVKYRPKPAKQGDEGPVVRGYQVFLKDWALYKKKLDGDFGKYTFAAVEKFQKKHRLKVDGKIGKKTAAKVVEIALQDEYKAGTIQKIC